MGTPYVDVIVVVELDKGSESLVTPIGNTSMVSSIVSIFSITGVVVSTKSSFLC